MTGSVIQLQMNFGYPGSYSRMPDDIVMNKPVSSESANIVFGTAVKLNADNTYSAGDSSLTAANFAGIAIREVKQGIEYSTYGVVDEQGAYRPYDPCDVLLRGNTVIKLASGTPTAGAPVIYAIAENAVAASGTITLTGNLTAADKITIGTTELVADTDFSIGANAAATAANIAALEVPGVTLSATSAVITVTAAVAGAAGNNIALATTNTTDVTLSGNKLSGGLDSTQKVGDFMAGSAVADKSIALSNMVFTTGEVDANGIVEVTIKVRNNN